LASAPGRKSIRLTTDYNDYVQIIALNAHSPLCYPPSLGFVPAHQVVPGMAITYVVYSLLSS